MKSISIRSAFRPDSDGMTLHPKAKKSLEYVGDVGLHALAGSCFAGYWLFHKLSEQLQKSNQWLNKRVKHLRRENGASGEYIGDFRPSDKLDEDRNTRDSEVSPPDIVSKGEAVQSAEPTEEFLRSTEIPFDEDRENHWPDDNECYSGVDDTTSTVEEIDSASDNLTDPLQIDGDQVK
jgi:hypothetical protein